MVEPHDHGAEVVLGHVVEGGLDEGLRGFLRLVFADVADEVDRVLVGHDVPDLGRVCGCGLVDEWSWFELGVRG